MRNAMRALPAGCQQLTLLLLLLLLLPQGADARADWLAQLAQGGQEGQEAETPLHVHAAAALGGGGREPGWTCAGGWM